MEIFICWMAMWAFSIGLCEGDTRGLSGLKTTAVYFMFWPLFLGCHLREQHES